MADLFSVTAPLAMRSPQLGKRIAIEVFPHREGGVLAFEPFWYLEGGRIHHIPGELTGEGPWRVGECIFTILACHGTDPELAQTWSQWQMYAQDAEDYPPMREIVETAIRHGAAIRLPDEDNA